MTSFSSGAHAIDDFFDHSLVEPFMKAVNQTTLLLSNADRPLDGLGQNEYAQYNLFSPGYSNSSSLSQELPSVLLKPYLALPPELPNHIDRVHFFDGDVFESTTRKLTSSITRTLLKIDVR